LFDLRVCVTLYRFSQVTSVGKQSLSVLFYAVGARYGPWFTKYVDAAVSPELEPAVMHLPTHVSGDRLLSWSDVPTAVRRVNTVGIFIKEFLMQPQLDNLTHELETRAIMGRDFGAQSPLYIAHLISSDLN